MGILDSYTVDNLVLDGVLAGRVEKIIHGSTSLVGYTFSTTSTIESIDVNRSILIFNTRCYDSSDVYNAKEVFVAGKINSSTQLYFRRSNYSLSGNVDVYINYSVIQFLNIKGKQVGEASYTNQNGFTISINPVNKRKSIAFCSHYVYDGVNAIWNHIGWYLSDTYISISFPDISASGTGYVYWQVLEFN